MFDKEFIIVKYNVAQQLSSVEDISKSCICDKDLSCKYRRVLDRGSDVYECLLKLTDRLYSTGSLEGYNESPYDELCKYEIDSLVYKIGNDIYKIEEILLDVY